MRQRQKADLEEQVKHKLWDRLDDQLVQVKLDETDEDKGDTSKASHYEFLSKMRLQFRKD